MNFTLHVGWSKDGIHWDINPDTIQMERDDPELVVNPQSYDPRITRLDDTFLHHLVQCRCARATDRAGGDEGL